jgi:hypothetical protein
MNKWKKKVLAFRLADTQPASAAAAAAAASFSQVACSQPINPSIHHVRILAQDGPVLAKLYCMPLV